MKRNQSRSSYFKKCETKVDQTNLFVLSTNIQRLFPWKTSKTNNRYDLNNKVSFRVVSECDIDILCLGVNSVELVSKSIRTGRELKRITVQLNDYSVSDDSMKALQCIYEMLKSGMIPDNGFSICGLFYLRPDGVVVEKGLYVLQKKEVEVQFKRGVSDKGTWILVTDEDLLNEDWDHPYMSVKDGVFTSRRGNENNNRKTLSRKRRFESSYNMDDSELKKWAAEHCIDRLENLEGAEIYMDDLATELTERENMDGTVFMSTQKSWDFISKNRYDAGDVLDAWVSETGTCRPNPLSDPDGFCVLMLEHYVREVLDECPSVESFGHGKQELTREMIDALTEELEQFC